MIKILNKIGIERNFLNMIKAMYEQLRANIKLNDKRIKKENLPQHQEQDKEAHFHHFYPIQNQKIQPEKMGKKGK